MKKLTLYVASTVLYTSFIMILAVSSIFFIFTYISQAGDIGQGGYTVLNAFLYALYDMPANIYLIMPVCGLLGGLMGLGVLSQNSELIVMRASGLSVFEIAKGVVLTASILAILTFLMGAYIAPYFQKKAIINKTLTTGSNNTLIFYNTQSLWIREGDTFIHVGRNDTDGTLRNITRYNVTDNVLTSVAYGQNARYKAGQWQVNHIKETFINDRTSSAEQSAQQHWHNLLPPSLLKIITSNTDYLNLNELADYIRASSDSQQNSNRIWLKFWQTLFQPFSLLILMLISVPFSLGSVRSSAIGYKFIIGMLLGFSFYITNQTFGPFSLVYHFPALLGAAIPSMIFVIILGVLFWKLRE